MKVGSFSTPVVAMATNPPPAVSNDGDDRYEDVVEHVADTAITGLTYGAAGFGLVTALSYGLFVGGISGSLAAGIGAGLLGGVGGAASGGIVGGIAGALVGLVTAPWPEAPEPPGQEPPAEQPAA